jgi:hypothetical protein
MKTGWCGSHRNPTRNARTYCASYCIFVSWNRTRLYDETEDGEFKQSSLGRSNGLVALDDCIRHQQADGLQDFERSTGNNRCFGWWGM